MSALKWIVDGTGWARTKVGAIFMKAAEGQRTPVAEAVITATGPTLAEAEEAAEAELRKVYDELAEHFAPVLRWESGEAKLLDCWCLRVWQWRDGSWVWSLWFRETQADGAYDMPSESEGRRAAEAALRSRGVVFRVEQNGGAANALATDIESTER